jgi:HD-GYP domain-containing protein (c-di-GMP phosphodiesterase class II)
MIPAVQIVRVEALKPGMQLARAVYSAEGQVLLSAGVILKDVYIHRLRALGFPAVYIGDPLAASDLTEAISETTRYRAIGVLQESFTSVKFGGTLHLEPISDVVNSMIDEMTLNRDVAVHLTDIRRHDDYTFGHSVNVCMLSLMVGMALEFDQLKLRELAMGAILHDVGKIKTPDAILLKATRLNALEWDEMKRHTRHGFDVLRAATELPARVAHVAYQHHERLNGSGYPRGLEDGGIHMFARIVAVADTYDAMTSDRVYRRGVTPCTALQVIDGLRSRQFDPEVVDAFMTSVVPYPPGCRVELGTGEVGLVVDNRESRRLVVEIESDDTEPSAEEYREIDLMQYPDKHIVRIV